MQQNRMHEESPMFGFNKRFWLRFSGSGQSCPLTSFHSVFLYQPRLPRVNRDIGNSAIFSGI
jgi:hypothetical protein